MIHPRSLSIYEPRPPRPEWVCSECQRPVHIEESGWHDCLRPDEDAGP